MKGRRFVLGCALTLAVLHASAAPASDPAYLDALKHEAHERQLANQTAWLRLLHAHSPRIGSGVESTIDFHDFFLAPDGKHDPQAELDATLDAFVDERPLYDEPRQCRFRARYLWLRDALGFDVARLPEQPCDRFREWHDAIDAGSLTVVFASNDLDSPSSMFGHTLMRLDARGAAGDQRLLAYAVNYAAQATRDAGFAYAIKGLTGFYQGTFGVMPYYEKVQEYERFEHRDLWEYPLLLGEPQREQLLAHLWELRGVTSDYYFFSENCSYQLLSLIEAADPSLDLTARFRGPAPYAIPVDTVRALRDAGVLGKPVFRPANAHRLQHRLHTLPDAQRRWALAYGNGEATLDDAVFVDASPAGQAAMLEVAHDALYFRFQEHDQARERGLALARPLLAARSRIVADPGFTDVPVPAASPDRGHESLRLATGVRQDGDGHTTGLAGFRFAYHDRLDPAPGYLAGGELEFGSAEVAFDAHDVRLDTLTLVNVQAVAPREAPFEPWSWFATLGARRAAPLDDAPGALGGYVESGGGWAFAPWTATQLYGFAMAAFDANQDLQEGYDVDAGARLGVATQVAAPLTLEASGQWLGGIAGAKTGRRNVRVGAQWSFGVGQGLRLEWRSEDRRAGDDIGGRREAHAVELRWVGYFRP